MTEISDAEVAEVQWASSERGKAAVRAAWEKAERLGITMTTAPAAAIAVTTPDVAAIVYAAYHAAGWEGDADHEGEPGEEAAAAHLHSWAALGVQHHTPFTPLGKPLTQTVVLMRCSECGEPEGRTLAGEWTMEDLTSKGGA